MPGETAGPPAVSLGTLPGLDGEEWTGVSLFAGIGGIDRALEEAGVKVKAQVEIDPACRGVLARHFPGAALFNDVTEVTVDQLLAAGFVPRRGILTAGFPCQDLSLAGRRAGLGGARSGLFWHVVRLADELRPQWILLENVPGLLSAVCPCPGGGACVANGRAVRCGEWRAQRLPGQADELGDDCFVCGCPWHVHDAGGFCAHCHDNCEGLPEVKLRKTWFPDVPHGVKGGACPGGCMADHGGAMGTVLGALGKLGYGFAYRVLDAQYFGVPQRRPRVFIAGCLGNRAAPCEVLLEPESGSGDPPAGREAWADIADSLGSRFGGASPAAEPVGALTASTGGIDIERAAAGQVITGTLTPGSLGDYDDNTARAGFMVVSTLQGGGRRGHRVDAEGAAGGHLVTIPAQAAPVAFDAAQITHPENRANPKPGDPAPPLAATGQPMVAGSRVISHTLIARERRGADSDAGSGIIVVPSRPAQAAPVAIRGRADGAQIEAGEPGDPAFAVRSPGGGSSYPMITHTITAEGHDASEDGTGRGSPLVSPLAYALSAGSSGTGVSRPGRRSEDDVNLVPVLPVTAVSNDASPVVTRNEVGTLKVGTGLGIPSAPAVATGMAVRRLSPRETERLQGYPDDWTRWLADGTEQSDSARYRQTGNSVAVPCVEWITRRIVAVWRAAQGSRGAA